MHGGNSSIRGIHAIEVPRKVHRPKVISNHKGEEIYPDVDQGHFLSESFGKAVFRPHNWDAKPRDDVTQFDQKIHSNAIKDLNIGDTVSPAMKNIAIEIVKSYWDVFDPEGICRHILGYEFTIDTGDAPSSCCRPPNYGPNEGAIIMKHIHALLANRWICETHGGGWGAPIVLAPKPHQEDIDKIADFIWRMCVSFRALNKITRPFQYPIGRCDDAIENLGDGAGYLFFAILDCAQGYHQIRVFKLHQDKLAFFAPNGKKYKYTVLPFGPVNAPPFYTAMIRRFQAEWTHLFQLYMNNTFTKINQDTSQPTPTVPKFPRSEDENKFRRGQYLPSIVPDKEFVLNDSTSNSTPTPRETYTASTVIKQVTPVSNHQIVTGSRTIIDDILLWSNSVSCVLLMLECVCKVMMKYRVSLKLKKCNLFSDRFEYVGRDILAAGNTTAKSKYELVTSWKRPATGDNLRSFVSFCNFYARFVPMFQVQCKPLRDLAAKYRKKVIPEMAWSPHLSALFENLKSSITSSPLLARYDSSKPLFLKTDWSATGMGYILMQPDNSDASKIALKKLLSTGICNFDISQSGARLQPILFNSRTCTATEKHYHGFVGEIACGRWAMAMEKRHLWAVHFFWLCDMATTYKILHYTGKIHTLQRWCQEMLAYNFACLHRSHTMMIDVDYLSRLHDNLIRQHVIISNALSLADRCARPCAYKDHTWEESLSRGKYSIKQSCNQVSTHLQTTVDEPVRKKPKTAPADIPTYRSTSPLSIRSAVQPSLKNKWSLDGNDPIHYCKEMGTTTWVSINRCLQLRSQMEQFCIQDGLNQVFVHGPATSKLGLPDIFADFIFRSARCTHVAVVDYTVTYDSIFKLGDQVDVHTVLELHKQLFHMFTKAFTPHVIIFVVPMHNNCPEVSTQSIWNIFDTKGYIVQYKILSSQVHQMCNYKRSIVIVAANDGFHLPQIQKQLLHTCDLNPSSAVGVQQEATKLILPIAVQVWAKITELICHHIVSHWSDAGAEGKLSANVYHIKPSPKNKNWIAEYKQDKDLSLLYNHFSIKNTAIAPDIINNVDRCYRMHLREDRVRFLGGKLVCHIPVGGENRFVCVLLVPNALRRILFEAYHASGTGGHLGINKTLIVLRLRFLWPKMRAQIIAWVKVCLTCVQLRCNTRVNQQLVHSWPLLAPFAIISADIWCPGDTVSPTGMKYVLNCMCDMTQFVVSTAISHATAAELSRAFMENVLLKMGICIVLVVDDGNEFMGIFEQMAKGLKIRLHKAAKRNHKAVGVERYHRFLNHSVTILSNERQTIKCFVEAAMISAFAWNAMPTDGTDIGRSVSAIGRPLQFPMDIAMAEIPDPIDDAGRATVRYMRNISHDARFAKDIVLWLTEERRERHRERVNDSRCIISYEVGDMVMARVQVNSNAKTGVVGKLSIESRGPFRVVTNHGNGSYTVKPFDKPNGAERKFLAQDMYALPPTILPCDQIDLPDLRYMNTDFAPVAHPFKDAFNIESYNSIWFDKQPPLTKPTLQEVCGANLPPAVESPVNIQDISVARPDTVEEMDASLTEGLSIASQAGAMVTESPLVKPVSETAAQLFSNIQASKDKLCFIAYRGANTIKPKWYLVQIELDDNSTSQTTGMYFVKFFRSHPSDSHKPHDCARYWPDWYEVKYTDSTRTVFDFGQAVLVRPSRSPNKDTHCRFSDSVCLSDPHILLVGPFDFKPRSHDTPASQIVPWEQWDKLSPAFHAAGIVSPKLANDPVLATHTVAVATVSRNETKWYHSSIQFTCKVLDFVNR